MNLEEAYEISHFTEDEIASIQRYLGFKHTNINMLGDFSPSTYDKLSRTGWLVPEKVEDIKSDIQDFVNVYSAMYKEGSKRSYNKTLVRGTSNKRVYEMNGEIPQFLSASTDEDIAKTFAEYGDGALVHLRINGQVPFLDPTPYRNEDVRDEKEIILAPFCKAQMNFANHANDKYGFSYYEMEIQKPELEEKTTEELDNLQEEILSRFSQNMEDIRELLSLEFKLENFDRHYKQAQGDLEEQEYILKEHNQAKKQYDNLRSSTYDFKTKLESLLKGMCRQKEIEIDQAHEIIETDRQRRKETEQKRKAEELARKEIIEMEEKEKSLVSELSDKLAQNPQNVISLQNSVVSAYEVFVRYGSTAESIAQKFGFSLGRNISDTSIKQLVAEIQGNMQDIKGKVKSANINETTTLEDAEKSSNELRPLLDGVSYGKELTNEFPEIQKLYKQQLDDEIKKAIYDKVQQVMQKAKTQKYLQEKMVVQEEKVGFFGKLFGKDLLKAEKLKNIDLKVKLAKTTASKEQENYSIRGMLADMHICADTELGGQFTEEMQQVYNSIKSIYKDKNTGEFTEEYIKSIAKQKTLSEQEQKSGLPAVQGKEPRFFGKTKNKIEALKFENENMQRKLISDINDKSTWRNNQQAESDAIALLEQRLEGIANNTKTRENIKDKDATLDLWK